MQIEAPTRYQRYLRNKQENPAGENGSVHVHEQIGQMRMKNSCEVIASGEAQKHGTQNEDCHRGEEDIVPARSQNEAV